MTRKIWALAILLILPSVFLFVGSNFNTAMYAGDPDYIYLMNAINLARGKGAGHIDNPGTPVMEIGTGLLHVHHLINRSGDQTLQDSVLLDPHKYVNLTRRLLVLLITLSLVLAGWFFFTKTGNIWLALIIQFTPFLSVNVLERSWTTIAPEPVLLFVTTLFGVLLAKFYFDKKKRWGRYLILFSILGGIGLATKATFIPLLVIPLFLFMGWKHKTIYLLGVIAAFFFFTFPAHKEYHNMFRWFNRLITHTGIYGSGEKGFIDISTYISNIGLILTNNPYFSITFFLVLAMLMYFFLKRKKRNQSLEIRMLLALAIMDIIAILIVAKHYHKNHYLLPELAMTGLFFFIIIESVDNIFKLTKWKTVILAVLLVVFIAVFLVHSIPELVIKNKGYYDTNREYYEVEKFMDCAYPDYLRVYHYPDGLNKLSALKFGNGYSKILNRFALDELYPEAYFFNVMTGGFQHWETYLPVEELIKRYGHKIIITGRPISRAGMQMLNEQGIFVKSEFVRKFQAVYTIDSISVNLQQNLIQ